MTRVEGITEYRLKNGLQLLLVPDDSKPSTTVNVTYRVGSRHESYGETGMAHLLEHLLFKGTPTTRNVWAEFTKRGLRANGTHLVRPDQLLRHLLGERRQPALVPRLAGRRDAQQLHRPGRPRHRDDGRAQRDGIGREQPGPGAAAADDGRHVPVAQLRQEHDRRPRRRRERRHSAAAGVLPQLLPAGQRDPDRLRPLRHRAGARDRGAELRPDPAADADPRADLHPRPAAGRRAHGDAAPRRRRAAGLFRLPRAARPERRLRRGDAAFGGARRHPGRAALQAAGRAPARGHHLRLHPALGRAEPALRRRRALADAGRREGTHGDRHDRRFARHRAGQQPRSWSGRGRSG